MTTETAVEQLRMRQLLGLLMAAVLLALVANGALFWRMNQLQTRILSALETAGGAQMREPLANGSPAPDFSLAGTGGHPVTLDDYRGAPVVLAFTSVRCAACKAAYPQLQALRESVPDLQILLLSQGTTEENAALAEEQRLTMPILSWDDQIIERYQVPATPYAFLVASDGTVQGSMLLGDQDALLRFARTAH